MSESDTPVVNPIAWDVEKGRDYWWCACGMSKTQPFLRWFAQGQRILSDQIYRSPQRTGLVLSLQKN